MTINFDEPIERRGSGSLKWDLFSSKSGDQDILPFWVADMDFRSCPEILQALLNLAGFLEHDPEGGLPIDISILAELALKCRAYAKALHYKEREHRIRGGNSCVEALISINRKLDLHGESSLTGITCPNRGIPICSLSH